MSRKPGERSEVPEETEVARVAREAELPEEQVEQLARAIDQDHGALGDAAGAAARWS